MMARIRSRRLPSECVQCGKAALGICPHHMGERRDPHTSRRLVRGLRKLLPIDGRLPDGASLPPDVIVLVPTLCCNLKCPYCFQRDEGNPARRTQQECNLNLAEWQAVIDEIKPLGLPVIVMGGELFVYPEALELLRLVKAAELSLTIITNGIALPRVAAELVGIGLNRLIVSIDGPPEVHNSVRGHPRAYELATEGIARVVAERGVCPSPFVQVSCAISVYTQAYLKAFVEAVGPLRVDRIVFNNLIYATAEQVAAQGEALRARFNIQEYNEALDNGAQLGVDPALIRREMSAIRAGPWAERVFVAPPGVEQHLEAYYAPHAPPFSDQFCTAIYRELWVLPNGDVGACVHITELSMGNVRKDGVMAAWNSPRYRRFRQHLAQGLLPACVRCEKLRYDRPPQ
jgi:radical SAM protein with 4Fe4S-binding SPASM domain